MDGHQGYYAIVQFSPEPQRLEFVNVGVVLLSSETGSVHMRMSRSPRRVERLFGRQPKSYFEAIGKSFEARIHTEAGKGWNLEAFQKFAASRANEIRLSKIQVVYIRDPKNSIDELYRELVGNDQVPPRRLPKIRALLQQRFVQLGIGGLVEQPEPVKLPEGVIVDAPFGYQNGAYNMIDPVRLGPSPGEAIKEAGKRAIEGKWLFHYSRQQGNQKRLVVVGDFAQQGPDFFRSIDEIMRANDVKLYRMDFLEPLAEDIRRSHALHR